MTTTPFVLRHVASFLVECARSRRYHDLRPFFENGGQHYVDCLCRIISSPDAMILSGTVSQSDAGLLAKGLTVAEMLGLVHSGSTNGIYRIRHFIGREDLDWLYLLGEVANPYIPFGSNGRCRHEAKNVEEYYLCQDSMHMDNLRAKQLRLLWLKARQAEGLARLSRMRERQAEKSALRDSLLRSLRETTPLERLKAMASSKRINIYYYPDEFSEFPLHLIDELSDELRSDFFIKLRRARKGRWRKLALQLRNEYLRNTVLSEQ